MAPIIAAMKGRPEHFDVRVCVTAQHREMIDPLFSLFDILPDYDLDLMQPQQTLDGLLPRMMTALAPVVKMEAPDWLLVQGDTTTAMAAGLVAFYNRTNLGHVEAGLRSYDKFQPYPEEMNRCIISLLSDMHFAPTVKARNNLIREGHEAARIIITGNTVIDALRLALAQPCDFTGTPLCHIPLDKRILLVTAHRRENFGKPLQSICKALEVIARRCSGNVHIVYPVHLNPEVRKPVYALLQNLPNITLLDPLDYRTFVHVMNRSHLVLTDSGGIQEEAPGLGKPVLVLRNTTERPEAVEAGTAKVIGVETEAIVQEVESLMSDARIYRNMANAVNPFGDGRAAERICRTLLMTSKNKEPCPC
jgi:UDP-N-acetylglucosamine 2-epimerase (non-hydrolysing)